MTAFDVGKAEIKTQTFLVVSGHPDTGLERVKVTVSGSVRKYLEGAWADTLEWIGSSDPVAFSPDLVVRGDDGTVVQVDDDLRPDSDLIKLVLDPGDVSRIKPSALEADSLYAYAVVSKTPAGKIAMIKKGNPSKRAHDKQWVLRGDQLRELEDDPWQLHPYFDLAVTAQGGWVLNYWAFEQLMKDSPRIRENVDTWVGAVGAALPMSTASAALLSSRCQQSTRLLRRLRAINSRGHIARVSVAQLQRHLREEGLKPTDYVKKGELVVTEANVAALLEVLNEDLFRGGLTSEKFVSDGKRVRR